jgi:hypothetical protein
MRQINVSACTNTSANFSYLQETLHERVRY